MRAAILRNLIRCFAACLSLALPALQPARATPPPWTVQDPLAAFTSAQELEARLEFQRKSIWDLYGREYTAEPDVRGRTFRQDIDEWLLPPASVSRLEALQSKARAQDSAHQAAALRKTLDEATALLQLEDYREDLINDYWFYQTHFVEHQRLLEQLVARLPPQSRTGISAEVTGAVAEAGKQLSAALAAVNPTLPEQQANAARVRAVIDAEVIAYNQQRAKLAAAVTAAERASGVAPLQLLRSTPCPPEADKTSGGPKPRVDTDAKPTTALDYPESSRKADVEGAVIAKVTVSPAGCALQAEVDASSGAPELDAAALRWLLTARYLPAEVDHHAVQAVLPLRVKFQTR